MGEATFPVLEPDLQVSFYYKLHAIRRLHLGEALTKTLGSLDIQSVDAELAQFVDKSSLRRVAQFGVRGEVMFAVPVVLAANPFLLGYYRLLLGFSQKAFYHKGPFGRFRSLEEKGVVPPRVAGTLAPLCESLVGSAERLVDRLTELSVSVVHELQLLTLGAQLRGSENTRIGQRATEDVRMLIESIVKPYAQQATSAGIILENESNRKVLIEFAADPDVCVTEQLSQEVRPTLAIEIKGGADASNIHNRLGEAEKSHQKARNRGFREFWTILSVDIDEATARRASPTTGRFFNLQCILDPGTTDHRRFRDLFCALIGIRARG